MHPINPERREIEGVIRSDVSEAHRLSLSARVLSAEDGQVKAKRHRKKRLCRLRNQSFANPWLSLSASNFCRPILAKSLFYPGNIRQRHSLRLFRFPQEG